MNYSQATQIPERIRGETDEIVIEKQAIMDVLLESRVWGAKYLSNPFPYVVKDITQAKEKEIMGMKKCFAVNYNKYLHFKNMKLKEIGERKDVVSEFLELGKSKDEFIKKLN